MRKIKIRGILLRLLILLLCGVALLGVLRWGRGCLFRNFTGIPCPGCGMTRAWLAALRFDFAEAFHHHSMFWSVPVLILFCLFDGRIFRSKWLNFGLLGFIALGVVINYIVMLVAFLSGTPTV